MPALVLLLAMLAIFSATVSACGGPTPEQKAVAERRACFEIQKKIAIEMAKRKNATGAYPDVSHVIGQLHAQCPQGGQYSFDGVSEKVSCSIHGVAR